jgi:hypothetical protein
MHTPQTGNEQADHMLVWYSLIQDMALAPAERSSRFLRDASFSMTVVTHGARSAAGHCCVSACCALGAAVVSPYFNDRGLSPAIAKNGEADAVPSNGRGLKPLHQEKVHLGTKNLMYDDRKLAAFFGLPHKDYLRIVEPTLYANARRILPEDVLAVMRAVMIDVFKIDPALHPFIREMVAA